MRRGALGAPCGTMRTLHAEACAAASENRSCGGRSATTIEFVLKSCAGSGGLATFESGGRRHWFGQLAQRVEVGIHDTRFEIGDA